MTDGMKIKEIKGWVEFEQILKIPDSRKSSELSPDVVFWALYDNMYRKYSDVTYVNLEDVELTQLKSHDFVTSVTEFVSFVQSGNVPQWVWRKLDQGKL